MNTARMDLARRRHRHGTAAAQVLATLVMLVIAAQVAHAQEAATNLAGAQALTRPGDTVYVSDQSGRQTKLKPGDAPLDQLIRQTGLSETDVRGIEVERRDSPWNGALIGLAVVGVPWLVVCAANDWCYYNEYGAENMLRTTAIVTTAMGAGIGALLDLSKRKRITIFKGDGTRSLELTVSPSTSGVGAQVRMHF